jgi:hypothetical protein
MKKIITYVTLSIDQLERYPLHVSMFLGPEEKKPAVEWLTRSIDLYGKLNNIFGIQQTVDGAVKNYIIDGWLTVEVLKAKGISTVSVAMLNLTEEKDIAQVMVELQKSHHGSLKEEYKIYESLYSIFSKGRGHRSDLEELTDPDAEETGIGEDEQKKRRATVYEVIAKMCGISKHRVQYLLKVGRVNPWHFERIEKERYPLYAAYLDCRSEETGEEPPVPTAKTPVYESDVTEAPVYAEPTPTIGKIADEEYEALFDEDEQQCPGSSEEAPYNQPDATQEEGLVSITVQVRREDLIDTDNTPEVTIDKSNTEYVIVQLKFLKQ